MVIATPNIVRHHEHGMYIRERQLFSSTEGKRPARSSGRIAAGTLLFVHGLGESGLCFEHLLEHLGLSDWNMLVPDLPGYGCSPWTTEPLSLTAHADHLASWLRKTGRGPVVVVGHSMGGVVGLLLCERHPELIRAIVDVDGNISLADCGFSSQAAAYTIKDFMRAGFDRLREIVFRAGRDDRAQRGYYVSLRLCDPRLYHQNSAELVAISSQEELAKRLVDLSAPSLYMAGSPNGVSEHSRRLLDEARVNWCAIQPAGHWPFIDQPDNFVVTMARFLKKLR